MKQNDLNHLLALGEGFTTEFKRPGTSNLGREICVFANATGGVILIGVTDFSPLCARDSSR
jgi:ATP-dependent DNA helicase RecG